MRFLPFDLIVLIPAAFLVVRLFTLPGEVIRRRQEFLKASPEEQQAAGRRGRAAFFVVIIAFVAIVAVRVFASLNQLFILVPFVILLAGLVVINTTFKTNSLK